MHNVRFAERLWEHMGRHHGFGRGRGGREFFEEARAARTRRGDIKFLILDVIADRPRHGYDVITALEEKSGGRYRPSPGSVYPTLQLLEEGGFLAGETVDGKRVFSITDAGRELLSNRPADPAAGADEDAIDLRGSAMRLGAAVMQVARMSDTGSQEKVRAILDRARKEVYAILAEAE